MALPQLILIPGRLNDGDLFRDQLPALGDVCRPVVADVTRGRSFAELAATVLDLGEDRFALAGFSFGGIVAMEVARQAPERLVITSYSIHYTKLYDSCHISSSSTSMIP